MFTPSTLRTRAAILCLVIGTAMLTLLLPAMLIDSVDWSWRFPVLMCLWPVLVAAGGTVAACAAFQSVGDAFEAGVKVGEQRAQLRLVQRQNV